MRRIYDKYGQAGVELYEKTQNILLVSLLLSNATKLAIFSLMSILTILLIVFIVFLHLKMEGIISSWMMVGYPIVGANGLCIASLIFWLLYFINEDNVKTQMTLICKILIFNALSGLCELFVFLQLDGVVRWDWLIIFSPYFMIEFWMVIFCIKSFIQNCLILLGYEFSFITFFMMFLTNFRGFFLRSAFVTLLILKLHAVIYSYWIVLLPVFFLPLYYIITGVYWDYYLLQNQASDEEQRDSLLRLIFTKVASFVILSLFWYSFVTLCLLYLDGHVASLNVLLICIPVLAFLGILEIVLLVALICLMKRKKAKVSLSTTLIDI